MNFIQTPLQGLYIIEPTVFNDERGSFARLFCKKEFSQIGHSKEFVQFNHSTNKLKGTLRGMHYQKAPYAEIKLIRCVRGSVFDVAIDMRLNSPTYLKWYGEILSADNRKIIYIPEGFAHGFQTLEDNTELAYHHTEYYTAGHEGAVNPLDTKIGVKWPVEISVMAEKDKVIPMLV